MHLNAYKVYHVIIVNSNTSRNVDICNVARSTINNSYIFQCAPNKKSSNSVKIFWTKFYSTFRKAMLMI